MAIRMDKTADDSITIQSPIQYGSYDVTFKDIYFYMYSVLTSKPIFWGLFWSLICIKSL